MRFDDPARPSERRLGETYALQTNGSALPSIDLVRPIQTEKCVGHTCTGQEGCQQSTEGCPTCERLCEPCWGWLASIHAHRGGNRFGYHTGIIPDLGRFAQEWLENPEACLAKYFRYTGPEAAPAKPSLPDLWGDQE